MTAQTDRASKFKKIATAAKPEAEEHARTVFENDTVTDDQDSPGTVVQQERPKALAEPVKKYPQVTISASPSDKQLVLRLQSELLAGTGRNISKSDIYAAALKVFSQMENKARIKYLSE